MEGGAESIEKQKQYKYNENANLVIARQEHISKDSIHTGESTTLSRVSYFSQFILAFPPFLQIINSFPTKQKQSQFKSDKLRSQMGVRAAQDRPKGKEMLKKKAEEGQTQDEESRGIMRRFMRSTHHSVMDTPVDPSYRPQTKESQRAYEVLMLFVEKKFGAQVLFLPHTIYAKKVPYFPSNVEIICFYHGISQLFSPLKKIPESQLPPPQ